MSLINKMLQDLENRRHGQKTPEQTAALNFAATTPSRSGRRIPKRMMILIVIAAIVVIMLALFSFKSKAKALNYQVKQPNQVATTVVPEKEVPEPPVALVKEVSITQNQDITTMVLGLDSSAQYRLSQPNENELELNLFHAKLQTTLDQLPLKDTAITSVTSTTQAGDLIIDMHLAADTEVRNFDMDEKQSQLTLTLRNANLYAMKKVPVQLTSEQKAQDAYQAGVSAANSGDVATAKQHFAEALVDLPSYAGAREALAMILLKQQDYASVDQLLDNGLQQAPNNIKLIQLKAYSLLAQNKAQAALSILQTASPLLRSAPNYYSLMAIAEQQLAMFNESAALYEQLLQIDPNRSAWWMGLAISYEGLKQNNQAINAYDHALSSGQLTPALQNYVSSKLKQLHMN